MQQQADMLTGSKAGGVSLHDLSGSGSVGRACRLMSRPCKKRLRYAQTPSLLVLRKTPYVGVDQRETCLIIPANVFSFCMLQLCPGKQNWHFANVTSFFAPLTGSC